MTPGGPPFDDPAKNNRRTLYAKVSRSGDQVADAFLRLFDFPLMRATIAERPKSVVPQQFLFMMNSQFMVDRAQALAERLMTVSSDTETQIRHAYGLLFGRKPLTDELQIASKFLSKSSGATEVGEGQLPILVQYAQVLLSSNEFMYVR